MVGGGRNDTLQLRCPSDRARGLLVVEVNSCHGVGVEGGFEVVVGVGVGVGVEVSYGGRGGWGDGGCGRLECARDA